MYDVLRPWLFRLDPERAHGLTFAAARFAQAFAQQQIHDHFVFRSALLGQRHLDLDFENPVGVAAGLDKNATLLPLWRALGFGFVEVGSVTAHPAKGNQRPRLFRLPKDRAIINRLGLPNQGASRIARRMARIRSGIPVGISIAKTHDRTIIGTAALEDYRRSFELLAPQADYIALNISCPNTADGKTFEDPKSLDALLKVIFAERAYHNFHAPIFLKISPIVSERVVLDSRVDEILSIGRAHGVRGYIAANTTTDRMGVQTSAEALAEIGAGGLSGPPLHVRTLHLVRYLYRRLEPGIPVIGVGGIDSGKAAYAMLRAGASFVQLYTALVYEGPGLVRDIKQDLARYCERDGLASIQAAIGADA